VSKFIESILGPAKLRDFFILKMFKTIDYLWEVKYCKIV
jgi:hypothetical protein